MTCAVFIAFGSNLGKRQKNCKRAVQLLKDHPHIKLLKVSKWVETKALTLPGENHPDFLNGVVQIETDLSPSELFKTCKTIEYEMGRRASEKKWQPRIIDLDILFYEDQIVNTPDLTIPHPHLHERGFVLRPLNDIAPDWIHPLLKNTVAELLQILNSKSEILNKS